jgi:hypothetical protein
MLAAAPLLQLLLRGGLVGTAPAAATATRSAATAAAATRNGKGRASGSTATPPTPSIPPTINPASLSFDDLHAALSQRANKSRNPQPESGLVLLASKASSPPELERCLAVVRANARRRARLGQRPSHSPRVGAALASAAARVGAPASWAVDLVARAEEFGVAATGGLAERAAALCAQQGDAVSAEALAMATRARAALLSGGGGGRAPPALTRNQATDAVRAAVKAAKGGGGEGSEGAAAGGAAGLGVVETLAAQARDLGKLGPMASRIAAGGAGGSGGGAGGTGGGTAAAAAGDGR